MALRLFQRLFLELKNKVPFLLGVVNAEGKVIACTEPRAVGEKIASALEFYAAGEEGGQIGSYTFRRLRGCDASEGYAVFARAVGESATLACSITIAAIANSSSYSQETQTKLEFVKKILLETILPEHIYAKSREMQFPHNVRWAVYFIRTAQRQELAVMETIQAAHPDRQRDFALTINERETVFVKELPQEDGGEALRIAQQLDAAFAAKLGTAYVIGVGGAASQLKDIARSFKEAQAAVEIGRVFSPEQRVMRFEKLGISRLIYRMPAPLCQSFLTEIFPNGSGGVEALGEEMLLTVAAFFDNDLNVSETARKLFVHRNTLVYRLEKIKRLTGLDLRRFDDAVTFKVALMVNDELHSREALC